MTIASRTLLAWYRDNSRDLPWRASGRTPWGVLVSEVMLQQTPVARVLPVWRSWLDRWPSPADFAAEPRDVVLRAWGSLGYPRRALRLHAAASAIAADDGRIPQDEAELRALPGIGAYTAAALAAFAFGHRTIVLDTNIRRVLARAIGGCELAPRSQTAAERDLAAQLLPADAAASVRWNQALMELGALVCTARSPDCQRCPLAVECAWLAAGRPPGPAELRRRAQPWAGTDRQARGQVMAALRGTAELSWSQLRPLWPRTDQLERALASLLADGLVESTGADAGRPDRAIYRLAR